MSKPTDLLSRFSFHTLPFTREIPVEERFALEAFDQPLEHLHRAVQKRMSAALIAPAGTGKTALLRALVARLPETRYRVHYVKVTDLSKRELCREISATLGTESSGTYPVLLRRLQQRFANDFNTEGLRPVMLIDEAHDIRPEVLGILRILTNFDMDSRLVVSFVLAGQPPLKRLLNHEKLQDVAHRLAHYATLRLLSRKELSHYVHHRCRIAGSTSCPFDPGALEALYEVGRGNLRATDHLALKALEAAHDADCDVLDSNHIIEARRMLWA
jgi:type II secretory pathway predicted ATPase ExeA